MFQIYVICDHRAEQTAMEIRLISTFGVFQRSIQSSLSKILLRKVNFAFMFLNPSLMIIFTLFLIFGQI